MTRKKAIDAVDLPSDGILMWDRPKQKRSKAEWKDGYGFEDGPTGGYLPNMSDEDARRWKAKLVGTKTGFPQVEIRKQAGPSLMTIIVNLGAGYSYKNRTPSYDVQKAQAAYHQSSRVAPMALVDKLALQDLSTGINVHIALNGPSLMTFQDMSDMTTAIEEAKSVLQSMESAHGERSLLHIDVREDHDPETVDKELGAIAGVRRHLLLAEERFIVLSITESALSTVRATSGVARIRTYDEFTRDGRRALDIAYGFDPDEENEA